MHNSIFWLTKFRNELLNGSIDSLKEILGNKPASLDIDIKQSILKDMSALEFSVFETDLTDRHNKEIVKLLLEHGANPLQEGRKGIAAYHAILMSEFDLHLEVLRHLEDIDAPLQSENKINALHMSAMYGNVPMMKYCLERGADPNRSYGDEKTTALFWAVRSEENREPMVRLLMQYGADINLPTYRRYTVLHTAVSMKRKDSHELVKLLLEYNPDLGLTSIQSYTPLYLSVNLDYVDIKIVQTLLEHGSDPNFGSPLRGNSLHILTTGEAATWKTSIISEILIRYGAVVNHQDEHGNTPLHYAVFMCSVNLIGTFIENGADVRIRNHDGKNALDLVHVCKEHFEVATIMVEHLMLQVYATNTKLCVDSAAFIEASSVLRRIKKECKLELKHMRGRKINNTDINFLDIFTSRIEKISIIARNAKTLAVLAKSRARDYKHYGLKLRRKIRAGLRRRRLEDYFLRQMNAWTNNILPVNCMQRIVDFLSDEDLKKFQNDSSSKKISESSRSETVSEPVTD